MGKHEKKNCRNAQHLIFWMAHRPKHMDTPYVVVGVGQKAVAGVTTLVLATSMVPAPGLAVAAEQAGSSSAAVEQSQAEQEDQAGSNASTPSNGVSNSNDGSVSEGELGEGANAPGSEAGQEQGEQSGQDNEGGDPAADAAFDSDEAAGDAQAFTQEGEEPSEEPSAASLGAVPMAASLNDSMTQIMESITWDDPAIDGNTVTFTFKLGTEYQGYTLACGLDSGIADLGENLGDNVTVEVITDANGSATNQVKYANVEVDNYNMEFNLAKVQFTVSNGTETVTGTLPSDGDKDKAYRNVDTASPVAESASWTDGGNIVNGVRYGNEGFVASFVLKDADAPSGQVKSGIEGIDVVTLPSVEGLEFTREYNQDTQSVTVTLKASQSVSDLSAKVTWKDKAGNEENKTLAELLGVSSLVLDTVSPVLSAASSKTEGDTYCLGDGDVLTLTLSDDNLKAMLNQENASSTVVATVKDKSGLATDIYLSDFAVDSSDEGKATAQIKLGSNASKGNGEVVLPEGLDYKISYNVQLADAAGNTVNKLSPWTFTLDGQPPVVTCTPGGKTYDGDSSRYYGAGDAFTVTLSDMSLAYMLEAAKSDSGNSMTLFSLESSAVDNETGTRIFRSVTLADVNEVDVNDNGEASIQIKLAAGATTCSVDKNGTVTLPEGKYTLSFEGLSLKDLANNPANKPSTSTYSLVFDGTAPEVASVKYFHSASDIASAQAFEGVSNENYLDYLSQLYYFYQQANGKAFAVVTVKDAWSSVHEYASLSGTGWTGSGSEDVSPSEAYFCFALDDAETALEGITLSANDKAGNSLVTTLKKATEGYASNGQDKDLDYVVNDSTAPSLSIDSAFANLSGYYASARTGTATITDANLKYLFAGIKAGLGYDAQFMTIAATDNAGSTSTSTLRVSDFESSFDSNATAQLSRTFGADADYHITFTPSNVADLSNNRNSAAAQTIDFTVDNINPVVEVTWNNNNAQNGKYYNAPRTATITVIEHNFDASLVSINAPGGSVGSWSNNGDVHTISVHYGTDGVCNLSLAMTDLAGRAASYTGEEFVIDQTAPTIVFAGVENQHAYNGVVAPVINFADEANFDASSITWTLVGNKVGTVVYNATQTLDSNGATVTFADFEHLITVDDIYTLTATVRDLAGNEYTATITFSVNRFGSNFIVESPQGNGSNTADLGVLAESPEIIISEINVEGFEESNVAVTHGLKTTNLRELDESTAGEAGYVINDVSDTYGYGWKKRQFLIYSASFEPQDANTDTDGNYVVVVSSKNTSVEAGGTGNANTSANFWVSNTDERLAALGEDEEPSEGLAAVQSAVNADANEEVALATASEQESTGNEQQMSAAVKFTLDTHAPEVLGLSVSDGDMVSTAGDYEITFVATDNIGFKQGTPDASGKNVEDRSGLTVKMDGQEVDYSINDNGEVTVAVSKALLDQRGIDISVVDYAGNETTVNTGFLDLYWPLVAGVVIVVVGGSVAYYVRRRQAVDDGTGSTHAVSN